jgi:hypothetical protein
MGLLDLLMANSWFSAGAGTAIIYACSPARLALAPRTASQETECPSIP